MFKQRLKDKIELLSDLNCFGHYKDRDLHYSIEYTYRAWSEKEGWYPYHNGYLWDTDEYKWFNRNFESFDEAADALEVAVDNQIKEEFSWLYDTFLKEMETEGEWIEEHPRFKSKEDIDRYYAKWKALTE